MFFCKNRKRGCAEYIRDFAFYFPRDFKQILAAPRNEFVAHAISRLNTVFVVVDKFPLFPCNLVEEKYQTVSHLVLHLFFKSADAQSVRRGGYLS